MPWSPDTRLWKVMQILCSVDSPTQAPRFRDQTVQLWEGWIKCKSHLEALWMENWLWYISDHAAFECSRLWSHKYYREEQGQGISTLLAWILTSESVSIIKWLSFAAIIVQLLSHIWPCNTNAARQAPLSSSKSQRLIKFRSIELVMISNHIILCCPLLLLSSIFPSIRVYSSESTLRIRWLEDWSFSHSISISNENSGLISFKTEWFDLTEVQGTLKNLLQHNLNASVLWHWAFFMVQLSHPYMTTGKTTALTIQTFVGKVMPLFFNTLPRFVIAFLPRNKHLLISQLQTPSAVILEPKKRKSVTASTFSPFICHEVMGPDVMILVFWMLSFKQAFSLSSFTLIKRLFSSFLFTFSH